MSERREEVKDVIYTGKEPFDKFDRQVSRWARRRFKGLHGHISLRAAGGVSGSFLLPAL